MSVSIRCDRCGHEIPMSDSGSFHVETKYTKGTKGTGNFDKKWDLCPDCRRSLMEGDRLETLIQDFVINGPTKGDYWRARAENAEAAEAKLEKNEQNWKVRAKAAEAMLTKMYPFEVDDLKNCPPNTRLVQVLIRDAETGNFSYQAFWTPVDPCPQGVRVAVIAQEFAERMKGMPDRLSFTDAV